ncbi:hypothetical protein WJX73_007923 [Symbiochloris irregularis]|uniref:Histone RNA hairpin-binding protein RNA-binding domain-containing protein n=1 Tax=Symbiochloris irregularis TaxID=706552 RepID=A0AAW1PUZ7_9CHLO
MENDSAVGNAASIRDTTSDFLVDIDTSESGLSGLSEIEENNPHRLAQRQKQIDYGKNTAGYQAYIQMVPRQKRGLNHPHTPDIKQAVSKRGFDYQVKKWRRRLHGWDPKTVPEAEAAQAHRAGSQGSPAFRSLNFPGPPSIEGERTTPDATCTLQVVGSAQRSKGGNTPAAQENTPPALPGKLSFAAAAAAAAAAVATPSERALTPKHSPGAVLQQSSGSVLQQPWRQGRPSDNKAQPTWASKGGKENAHQEVNKTIQQGASDDKAQYKHQQVQGAKRPQQYFSPQGRPETKRPARISESVPWSEDALWDDHSGSAEEEAAPPDIYGDWDMDAVAV